ncbi:MAG: hypothetical protein LBV32_11805 [Tannerellaceae bacterium]|jgi:hypothetical protein|nr:hypothetical protein [Tannerellaceae bacterium]
MESKVLNAVITGGKDQYGAWIEEVPAFGAGDTLEDTKRNLLEGLRLYMEECGELPDILKGNYEIKYSFDTSGYLKYISNYISFSGLNKLTGINQKQLWSYANGYREPNKKTSEKIVNAINLFGNDISQVQLRF